MAAFHQQLFFSPPAGLPMKCLEGSNMASEAKLLTLLFLSLSLPLPTYPPSVSFFFHLCIYSCAFEPKLIQQCHFITLCSDFFELELRGLDLVLVINVGFRGRRGPRSQL